MRYFAVLLPMRDTQKSQELRPQHLDYLARQVREGKVWARGRFTDGSGGLVIYRSESADDIRRIAENDPYVASGARGLEIHEWELITDDAAPA
jgi:uncharacterized protein YciI